MELKPFTLQELYDKTKAVYDKKFNRYVNDWYFEIMKNANKGVFDVTLFVCDWDCEEGEPMKVVEDAIEKIKELFDGVKVEQGGDGYLVYYEVSWGHDVLNTVD